LICDCEFVLHNGMDIEVYTTCVHLIYTTLQYYYYYYYYITNIYSFIKRFGRNDECNKSIGLNNSRGHGRSQTGHGVLEPQKDPKSENYKASLKYMYENRSKHADSTNLSCISTGN